MNSENWEAKKDWFCKLCPCTLPFFFLEASSASSSPSSISLRANSLFTSGSFCQNKLHNWLHTQQIYQWEIYQLLEVICFKLLRQVLQMWRYFAFRRWTTASRQSWVQSRLKGKFYSMKCLTCFKCGTCINIRNVSQWCERIWKMYMEVNGRRFQYWAKKKSKNVLSYTNIKKREDNFCSSTYKLGDL